MNKFSILVFAGAMLAAGGCSFFTPPLEHPVIEEKLNPSFFGAAKVGTLSLTPERRVVLVNFSNNRFCAEPPTEVGADISRLMKATAEADAPNRVKAELGAIVAATSSNSVLNKRSQGMQLFLANSYFLCQMYMNGAIEAKDIVKLQLQTFNAAAPLIEKELPLLYSRESLTSRGTFSPLDINKLLEEIAPAEGQTPGPSRSSAKPPEPQP